MGFFAAVAGVLLGSAVWTANAESAAGCTVSSYGELKGAMGCNHIIIKSMEVPVNGAIDLDLKSGTTVLTRLFR
jgi:hypothetical protein